MNNKSRKPEDIIRRYKVMDKMVLKEITRFVKENGYSPTVREIQIACEFKSTATVAATLKRLKESGKINYNENSPRTITLLKVSNANRKEN